MYTRRRQRDMTNFPVRRQTWLVAILLAASATGVAGCLKIGENGLNSIVVNHTNQTLTIVPRSSKCPGSPPSPTAADPTSRPR